MEADPRPPEDGGPVAQDNCLHEGFYVLRNKKTRTVIDLGGPADSMHQCTAHWLNVTALIGRQMWFVQQNSPNDTYTLKNLDYSKYLEVEDGPPQNESPVIPRPRQLNDETRTNQEWWIEEVEHGEYTLKCARTNTLLEIAGGDPSRGAKVTCSEVTTDNDHQIWILDRVSRTGSEIETMLEAWKPDITPRTIQPHTPQTEYFVLPHELRQSIWKETKLSEQPIRPGLFDYNAFVIKSHDAVNSWARDTYPAQVQGVAVLFGIIYGEARKGPKAYNWHLTRDMRSLVFFDAQIGEEYSSAALDEFGFEPAFVTF